MNPGPAAAVLDRPPALPLDRTLVAAFLENLPHAVYFKDRQSRFIAVSAAHLFNFRRSSPLELLGRTDFDFFTDVHASEAFADEQRIIRTGEPMLDKLEKETWPDGRINWVLTSKMPLRDNNGEIIGTFGISRDVTDSKQTELDLEKAHKDLLTASRIAGMAEVATGVLHNVGNVLNSLNVSASVLTTGLRQSKADSLARLSALLHEHAADLGRFLTDDPKGRRVPEFLDSLARHAVAERDRLRQELASLQKNIDHIKEIVSMQQAYATMVGVVEPLDPVTLMEDSLRMNAGALARHEVRIAREFQFVPPILAEKAKVLQILVNLIRNAKYACDESGRTDKLVTLRIESTPPGGPSAADATNAGAAATDAAGAGRVRLVAHDNGVGISPENLARIFTHGFTTRAGGHGFGLHSSANAAREMKGSLTAQSAGPGQGATFTLDLPAAPPAVPVA